MAFDASRHSPPGRILPARDLAEAAPPPIAIPIDSVADASLACARARAAAGDLRCDACDAAIDGEPAGRGLFVTTRGDEVRYEEPALCPACATAIGLRAHQASEIEEEEG